MTGQKTPTALGTEKIGKLLMQYAIPAIIAMTASSLYNMVDSIFIGQGVGPLAISGLAITFPLMNLSAAFGAAVGVGASTFISVKLGQKDYDTAKHILGNTMTLNLITGLGVGLVCLLFLDPILRFFGASDQTIPYARDYMVIILLGNVITHMYFGLNAVLRAAGKPKHAMSATIFTVVLNTLLDPLFIYTFGLGIKGAAYATVLAQSLALIWQLYIFSRPKELLHFKRGTFRLQSSIIRNIIAIGLSPFSMNVCACIVVILINNSMVHYGSDLAVGAYGIANKVAFIFVMINMGVNQGMQPIAGYNYGAMRYDRLMKVVKYSIIAATAIMTTGFIIAMTIPGPCARLFTTDPTLIDLSAKGIRYIMVAFPVVGYQMVVSNFFQSIGKAKISIVLSLSRQLLILLPLLLVLPTMFGINGVWVSMPVSDTLSAFMAAWIMIVHMRKFKKQHNEITNEQKVIDNKQKQLTNKQKDTNL